MQLLNISQVSIRKKSEKTNTQNKTKQKQKQTQNNNKQINNTNKKLFSEKKIKILILYGLISHY